MSKKTVPPPAFCVHPLSSPPCFIRPPFFSSVISLVLRSIVLTSAKTSSAPILLIHIIRFPHFIRSPASRVHPLLSSPHLPSFHILLSSPPSAPIFFIHSIRCTSSSQRSDAGRADLSVHRRGSHSSVRFPSKLA